MQSSGNSNGQKGIDFMKQYGLPMTIAGTVIGGVLISTILSLLVAIFAQTKPNNSGVKSV